MTQPQQSPSQGPTYQQALAAVASAQAALAASGTGLAALTMALSTGVAAARATAEAYAKTLILAAWGITDPYDGRSVQAFTETARRHVITAQTSTARSAAAAQAQLLQRMGVRVSAVPSNPVDLRASGVDVVGGELVLRRDETLRVDYDTRATTIIKPEEFTTEAVFNRPARTLRALEAEGATRAVADEVARERIERIVEDDVMLAQRFAEAEILTRAVNLDEPEPIIIGYRRVIHPELSKTGVCGLCIAAADQRYKIGTLLPIHARCNCTVAPISLDHDPADEVNQADLGALYGQAGGTSGAHLKRVRYQENEHGELGPVLVPKEAYKPRPAKKAAPKKTSPASTTPERPPVPAREVVGVGAARTASGSGGGGEPPARPPVGGGGGSGSGGDDPRITASVRRHILDGDKNGGGHRYTSTAPNKTLFPQRWDDDAAIAAVSETLRNPYTTSDDHDHLVDPNFLNLYGYIDGVRVVARLNKADGTLETAHPLDGDGVVRTGKKDGTAKKNLPLGSVQNVPLPHGLD
ncbi:hypothetical protein A5717_26030 [Mycolicibacterium porcinum]|uniref:EndoU domain-containing protein n=1 Tax=Mycolicibacterium porcinum TaxID=39693 RepID=UPI00080BB622|nr:EndoU domain-containing protein [Mycolicibacterium porcinum]OCB09237.1 hypothetical protein A5717_26030 [Mycolicibacterium porcinum]